MTQATVEVRNPHGLPARPAALFIRAAGAHKSSIRVRNVTLDRPPVDAKSMISVLAAAISKGHMIELVAEGADEDRAIETLVAFIESGAGESLEPQAPNG
jgi:phosphotransferase system HPr (HPr) family protein